MEKELKETKRINSTEDIIEAHKKAIKLVPVNWKGREIEIPVYYSMSAAITYEKAFKETKDYKKSFCRMVLKIINSNRKIIYKEDEFPILDISDIEELFDEDLQKIGEKIIYNSDYLKEIEEEVSKETDDFFEKFYLIHKKEKEKYSEKMGKIVQQLKPKLDMTDFRKNLFPSIELVSRINSITETVRPAVVYIGATYQNIIGNSALMEMAATASKMANTIGTYMEVINPVQRSIGKSIIEMKSALASTTSIVDATIKNFYSEINAIRDILQPINMEYVKTTLESQEALRRAINRDFQTHIKIFGAELNKILNFKYHDKLFNFANVQQNIINNIKPFLLGIQTILLARTNIKESLKEKAKTMLKFGWWFIGSLPIDIINYIHENKETLSQEDVDKTICDYYKADDCKELEEIISEWNELEYFSKWGKKIKDAFHAHKLEMYSLSVSVWALMIEGVIRDFMRDVYGVTAFKFSLLYNNFKEKAKELDGFIVNYAFNCMDSFYVRFNPEKPDGVHDFSRHKIFHGQAVNYDSEVNSLKLMLYLDELFYMALSLKNPIIA
ncbi:MAG: hypothetical protein JG776_2346 [Caloramator sp.]|jgi:hypothetical protein|uniref:hypothetical protein n=1 Tax=Caloramator sp. TaxID=1871330 RepID=UPI001DFD5D1D|nr:hypothetical protein [Caloramator sp.]MBZ4664622.1 hypothetical protein [Caloramator sp.]